MGINYIPNYIVDITEAFSKKINAINAHISQNPKSYIDAVTIWNRFRSAQCNAPNQIMLKHIILKAHSLLRY